MGTDTDLIKMLELTNNDFKRAIINILRKLNNKQNKWRGGKFQKIYLHHKKKKLYNWRI